MAACVAPQLAQTAKRCDDGCIIGVGHPYGSDRGRRGCGNSASEMARLGTRALVRCRRSLSDRSPGSARHDLALSILGSCRTRCSCTSSVRCRRTRPSGSSAHRRSSVLRRFCMAFTLELGHSSLVAWQVARTPPNE